MSRAGTWAKMLGGAVVLCVGGPALVQYVRPSDEDLFRSYNTDLKKRSLEDGPRRAKEFDDYVNKLKEWSKSDKSIWVAAQEQAEQGRSQLNTQRASSEKEENKIQKDEMRKEMLGDDK